MRMVARFFASRVQRKQSQVPGQLQEGLRQIGPFMAHDKTGFALNFTADNWYEQEVPAKGYRIAGHHHAVISATGKTPPMPQDGYSFVCEMNKSWILFVMKDVEWQSDPREMYFANAFIKNRVMKNEKVN